MHTMHASSVVVGITELQMEMTYCSTARWWHLPHRSRWELDFMSSRIEQFDVTITAANFCTHSFPYVYVSADYIKKSRFYVR